METINNLNNIKNKYVRQFICNLCEKDRKFSTLTDSDKSLLNDIYKNYSKTTEIESGQDVYSLHLIAILDEFIYSSIIRNRQSEDEKQIVNMFFDENIKTLSNYYYKALYEYFDSLNRNNFKKKNLDNVKWIKSILSYIDRESNILYLTSDFSAFRVLRSVETLKVQLTKKVEQKLEILDKQTTRTEEAEKRLNLIYSSVSDLMPNMLTVLSIFVGAIISIFVVYITFFLEPKNTSNFFNTNLEIQLQLSKYVLSGHILGNILFLLLFLSANITNRSILTSCNLHEFANSFNMEYDKYMHSSYKYACRNCKKRCNPIKKLFLRAGYILAFNLLMVSMYIVLYLWWITSNYWDKLVELKSTPHIYIVSTIIGLFFLTFVIIIYSKLTNKSKNQYYKIVKSYNKYISKLRNTCFDTNSINLTLTTLKTVYNEIKNRDSCINESEMNYIKKLVSELFFDFKSKKIKLNKIPVNYKKCYNAKKALSNLDYQDIDNNILLFGDIHIFLEEITTNRKISN